MPAAGRTTGHHGPTLPGLAGRHGCVQCRLAGRPQRALPHLQGPAQLWGQSPGRADRLPARQPDRLPGPLVPLRCHLLHRWGSEGCQEAGGVVLWEWGPRRWELGMGVVFYPFKGPQVPKPHVSTPLLSLAPRTPKGEAPSRIPPWLVSSEED